MLPKTPQQKAADRAASIARNNNYRLMEHLLKIDAGKLEAGLEVQLQPWQTEERIEWAKTESRADRAHLRRRVELEKIPANLPPARHYNGFPIHYNPHYEERDMRLAEIGWQQLDHFRVRYWTTNSSETHRDSFFALTGIRLQPPGRQQPIPAAVMQLYPSLMEAPAGAAQPAVANATVEEQPVADAIEEEGAIGGGEEVAVGGEEEEAVLNGWRDGIAQAIWNQYQLELADRGLI